MTIEERISRVEEALFAAGLLQRPAPPEPPQANAYNVTVHINPLASLGADLFFDYQCGCGFEHSVRVENLKGARYGSVRTHTTTCTKGITTRVVVQLPMDPARELVQQALQS